MTILVRKKPMTVVARQVTETTFVSTAHGMVPASPGDWILTDAATGDSWPIRKEIFELTYERIEDSAKAANTENNND